MYKNITSFDFYCEMKDLGFSHEGSENLFEFLENRESEMGQLIEFDPISFSTDFTEYESLYDFLMSEKYTEDDYKNLEEIANDCVSVIDLESGGFILEGFNGK